MDVGEQRSADERSAPSDGHGTASQSGGKSGSDTPADSLLVRWREGYESLGRLLAHYRDEIAAAVRRKGFSHDDSDDAVQGFAEKLLRSSKPPDHDFRRWFLRGATNLAVDQGRRVVAGRRKITSAAPALGAVDNSTTLDELAQSDRTRERAKALEELKGLCADAVLDLPEDKQRELIGRVVNMSYAEIAEWVEKTTSAVGVDLHRTVATLRRRLGDRVLQIWKAREA